MQTDRQTYRDFFPTQPTIYANRCYRLKTAVKSDERIKIMNEVISAMRVIKMYTWEGPFANQVAEIRR